MSSDLANHAPGSHPFALGGQAKIMMLRRQTGAIKLSTRPLGSVSGNNSIGTSNDIAAPVVAPKRGIISCELKKAMNQENTRNGHLAELLASQKIKKSLGSRFGQSTHVWSLGELAELALVRNDDQYELTIRQAQDRLADRCIEYIPEFTADLFRYLSIPDAALTSGGLVRDDVVTVLGNMSSGLRLDDPKRQVAERVRLFFEKVQTLSANGRVIYRTPAGNNSTMDSPDVRDMLLDSNGPGLLIFLHYSQPSPVFQWHVEFDCTPKVEVLSEADEVILTVVVGEIKKWRSGRGVRQLWTRAYLTYFAAVVIYRPCRVLVYGRMIHVAGKGVAAHSPANPERENWPRVYYVSNKVSDLC